MGGICGQRYTPAMEIERYSLHAAQLATRGDLAEAKMEIIKWTVGTMFAAVGLFAAIVKLWI